MRSRNSVRVADTFIGCPRMVSFYVLKVQFLSGDDLRMYTEVESTQLSHYYMCLLTAKVVAAGGDVHSNRGVVECVRRVCRDRGLDARHVLLSKAQGLYRVGVVQALKVPCCAKLCCQFVSCVSVHSLSASSPVSVVFVSVLGVCVLRCIARWGLMRSYVLECS